MNEKELADRIKANQAAAEGQRLKEQQERVNAEASARAYRADLEKHVASFGQALAIKIDQLNTQLPDALKLTSANLIDHPEGRFYYYGNRACAYYLTPIPGTTLSGFVITLGLQENLRICPSTTLALWAGKDDHWYYQRYRGQVGGDVTYCPYCQKKPQATEWFAVPSDAWLVEWALNCLTAATFPLGARASLASAFVPGVRSQWHDECSKAQRRAEEDYRRNHPMGM